MNHAYAGLRGWMKWQLNYDILKQNFMIPVVVNSLSYYIDNNHRITMDSNRVYNSIDIKIYVAYLYVRDYITSLQYM